MNPISALLALLVYCVTLAASDSIPPRQQRHEVCPDATSFYSGQAPAWAKNKRVICQLGRHVFLTDKPEK